MRRYRRLLTQSLTRLVDCTRMRPSARPLGAVLVALLFLAPLSFLVTGALREPGLLPTESFPLLPDPPTFASLERAFELVPLGRQLLNSVIVAAIAVPIARRSSRRGRASRWCCCRARARAPTRSALSLVLLMVPLAALWLPRFVLFRWLGVVDTWIPLIAPALLGMSPFYVLLFYWSYRRVPRDLIDAGRLEGLGAFGLWRRVAVAARPADDVRGRRARVRRRRGATSSTRCSSSTTRTWRRCRSGCGRSRRSGRPAFPVLLAGALVATMPGGRRVRAGAAPVPAEHEGGRMARTVIALLVAGRSRSRAAAATTTSDSGGAVDANASSASSSSATPRS